MTYIILFFGILIGLGGVVLLVKPDYIFSQLKKYGDSLGLHVFAIVTRIILGVALITGASESRYPVALQSLGWLVIFAALVLGVIGRERFKNLLKWVLKLAPSFQRLAAVFAILFSVFLIQSVI